MSDINLVNTKEKILLTAIKLFSKHGYDTVSLSKIAKEVGITKPAIYYHFDSKEKLVEETFDFFINKSAIWVKTIAKSELSVKDIFKQAYMSTGKTKTKILEVENFTSFQFKLYSIYNRFPSLKEKVKISLEKFYGGLIEKVEKDQKENKINPLISATTIVYGISLILIGVQIAEYFEFPDESTKEDIFEMFWKAISPD